MSAVSYCGNNWIYGDEIMAKKKKKSNPNPAANNGGGATDELLEFVKSAENAQTVSTPEVREVSADIRESENPEPKRETAPKPEPKREVVPKPEPNREAVPQPEPKQEAVPKPEPKREVVPKPEPVKEQPKNDPPAETVKPVQAEEKPAKEEEPKESISDIFAQKDREFAERMGFAASAPPKKPNSSSGSAKSTSKSGTSSSSARSSSSGTKSSSASSAAAKPSAPSKHRPERDPLYTQKVIKSGIVGIVAMVAIYMFSMIYSKSLADDEIEMLESRLLTMKGNSLSSNITEIDGISLEQRENLGLSDFLCDSDSDGLSDAYELNITKTDPLKYDSDGDGVADGIEVKASLDPNNPKTNGTDEDGKLSMTATVGAKGVTVELKGTPDIYRCYIEEYKNNSMAGTPGMIGSVYQFYAPKIDEGKLTFTYTDKDIEKWSGDPNNLSVFWYNSADGKFDMLNSTVDETKKTVSTKVTESGIFALGDTGVVTAEEYDTNIFFLIDNSGSMYPEAMCMGSEENDVDFKRLDLATSLMNAIEGDANYGLAKFTATYTKLSDLTSDKAAVNAKLESIKSTMESFNGTEIAVSLSNAVTAFKNTAPADRNYILLLTDGMPTTVNPAAEKAAIDAANNENVSVFVIGLGKYVDSDYLTNIAELTNGMYFQVSNADALAATVEKISSFLDYGIVQTDKEDDGSAKTEEGESSSVYDMFMIADTGFSSMKDGLAYKDFRTSYDTDGTGFGIAEFVSRYYTGNLELTASDYTVDGKTVKGYDLRNFPLFTDGKADLRNFHIQMLDKYNEYLSLDNKWDFKSIKDGVLLFSDDARAFVEENGFGTVSVKFDSTAHELQQSNTDKFLRYITFQTIRDFEVFQCAVLDNSVYTGDDLELLNAFIYFHNLHLRDDCRVYNLSTDGSAAFEMLCYLMKTGEPVVITLDNNVVNAVRLLREIDDPNKFVLEVYDANYPDQLKKVILTRTPVLTQAGSDYQYRAKFSDRDVMLSFYTFDE